MTYEPLQGTQLVLSAGQSMAPNTLGEVQNRSTIGVGLRQAINHSSNLSLSADFSHLALLDGNALMLFSGSLDHGNADLFRASIAYDHRLTQDWLARVSYRFAVRDDDTGRAHSDTVYFSAVRAVTILP